MLVLVIFSVIQPLLLAVTQLSLMTAVACVQRDLVSPALTLTSHHPVKYITYITPYIDITEI